MILVTGSTGFIGRALVKQLVSIGEPVRALLRPSLDSPRLPRGVPVDVAICSLRDERSLRAAMKGVDIVYHLTGTERGGSRADLNGIDVEGTQILAKVAYQAGVERFIYISHLGADRFSAYPVLKAKALAEGHIIQTGINYTIFRSSIVFGPNDQFTTSISRIIKNYPIFFFLPGDGKTLIQPIWIEDLVTCLLTVLDNTLFNNQVLLLGGMEYYSFRQIVELIMDTIRIRRNMISVSPVYLRWFTLLIEPLFRKFPISIFWLDYLASNRICPLDALPRQFGLMPARMSQMIEYLKP